MHPYNTDSEERKWVIVGLVSASILLVYLFYDLLGALKQQYTWLDLPWWIEAPSIVSVFTLLYYVFDQWIWRWPIFRWLGLIKTPYIHGEWQGHVKTSHDKLANEYPVTVIVHQTWSRLSVCLTAERSTSKSVTAAMFVNEERVPLLRFIYLNDPQPEATKTMQMHHGTAIVRLLENGQLSGTYYTGRGRASHGSLVLNRVMQPALDTATNQVANSQANLQEQS